MEGMGVLQQLAQLGKVIHDITCYIQEFPFL